MISISSRVFARKKFLAFLLCTGMCLSVAFKLKAQTPYIKSFEKNLTPSPMVGTLGTFGGIEVRKTTGGMSKTIPLLSAKSGDLTYQPSLEYFSNGIRVDDWGSRVGMGWSENLTATITRVVKNIPDERAITRIGDGRLEFGESGNINYTQANYDKLVAMSNSSSYTDGEYDIFNFNIFGATGQFIIRNNQAVMLKDDDSFRIQIVQTSPTYLFILTDNKGVKYYFDSETEQTKFNTENSCDEGSPYSLPYTTAWFLHQIVSPLNRVITFNYQAASFDYIYDFNEYYVFSEMHYGNTGNCNDDPGSGDHNYCLRRKSTNTKILSSVSSDNFLVNFYYASRNDIYNEKLLSKVTVSSARGQIRAVDFNYQTFIASTTFEPLIQSSLTPGQTWEVNALKTRYYLNSLTFTNSDISEQYKFTYLNPQNLPHRFAFSQDYLGYYNAKGNAGLVPKESTDRMPTFRQYGFPYPAIHATEGIPFANRKADIAGLAGALSTIQYPTGGKDSIVYGQNRFTTRVDNAHQQSYTEEIANEDAQSYTDAFAFIHLPITTAVDWRLEFYHDPDLPITEPFEEYQAVVELYDSDNQKHIFPNGKDRIELHLGSVYNSGSSTGIYPYLGKMVLEGNKDYELRFEMTGKHTFLKSTVNYTTSISNDIRDSVYYGYRVEKIITKSKTSPDMVKTYNYNVFKKAANSFMLTDSSSLNTRSFNDFCTTSFYVCDELRDALGNPVYNGTGMGLAITMYRLNSKNNSDVGVFGGSPFAYEYVTEFQDSNQLSFLANRFAVRANNSAFKMIGDINSSSFQTTGNGEVNLIAADLTNLAWNNGLQLEQYAGTKSNNSYQILNAKSWRYSADSTIFFNYGASKILTAPKYSTDIKFNMSVYTLKSYETYSHWVRLDTLAETNYLAKNGVFQPVTEKLVYVYNPTDKGIEEEWRTASNQATYIRQSFRAAKMVSLGADTGGIFQEMLNRHMTDLPVERKQFKTNLSTTPIEGEKITYGYFRTSQFILPKTVLSSQAGLDYVPRIQLENYDDNGNITQQRQEAGASSGYQWDYSGQYPVVNIKNSSVGNVFYESFEQGAGNGIVEDNMTGHYSHTGAYVKDLSSLSPGNYRLRYWQKNGSAWSLVSTPVTVSGNSYQINLNAQIDDVCFYPAAAQIETYTFDPLVGMTSRTDPKGLVTYYEYDGLGRLQNIKDYQGNIVKSFDYNYRPQ